jgi:hypothetical protein
MASPEISLRPVVVDHLVFSAVDEELKSLRRKLNRRRKITSAAAYLEHLLDTENSVKARINNIKTIMG